MTSASGIKHIQGRVEYQVYWAKKGVTQADIKEFIKKKVHQWFPEAGVKQADFWLGIGKRPHTNEEVILMIAATDIGTDWSNIQDIAKYFEVDIQQRKNHLEIIQCDGWKYRKP